MIYVDSSILLAVYLQQPRAAEARALLAAPQPKATSWLLAIEVPGVLRRALGARPADRRLLEASLLAFDGDLRALELYSGLEEIAERVRADERFGGCRALDAIHVATALLLREEAGTGVQVATFDERLRRTAEAFRLPVLP